MTTYIFESRYNGNASTVSARHSIKDFTSEGEHVWRHKWRLTAWDYSLNDNHQNAVRMACRVQLQKDPVSITYGGDSDKGQLWIVTTTD